MRYRSVALKRQCFVYIFNVNITCTTAALTSESAVVEWLEQHGYSADSRRNA